MKKITTILLALALVLSVSVTSVSASTTSQSDAKIEFTEGSLEILPPGDKPSTGYDDIASSDILFGKGDIQGINHTRTPDVGSGGEEKVGFLVKDARGKATANWSVDVTIDDFTNATGPVLAGNVIKLTKVDADLAGPAANRPVQKDISLISGNSTTIFQSGATGSPGIWGANWTPAMEIIGGTEASGEVTATVTWSIIAGV